MANIQSYQFLRNQTPAQSLEDARTVLESHAVADNVRDGEIVLARYTDNGVVKTLIGTYYVSGSTKRVTITEPSDDVIADLEEYVNSAITEISGTASGESDASSAAGVIQVQFEQVSGKVQSPITVTNTYIPNQSTNYISAATNLQNADELLDAQVKVNTDAIDELTGGTGSSGSVDSKIEAAIKELDSDVSGETNGAAGTISVRVQQEDGVLTSVTVANEYTPDQSSRFISGATSLQDADNKLDTQVSAITDVINELTGDTSGSVDSKIEEAINKLDVNVISGEDQYIYAIEQKDGKISASGKTLILPDATVSGESNGAAGVINVKVDQLEGAITAVTVVNTYVPNTASTYTSGATSLQDADNKLDERVVEIDEILDTLTGSSSSGSVEAQIERAIDGLDVPVVSGEDMFIYAIKEDNGKISASAKTIPTSAITNSSTKELISSYTTVNEALDALADAAKSQSLSAADKSVVVTEAASGTTVKVNIKDVASNQIKLDADNGIYTDLTIIKVENDTGNTLGANIKEEYRLVSSGATGTTIGAPIQIYKDSSLLSVALLHASGNVKPTYDEATKQWTDIDVTAQTDENRALCFAYKLADGTVAIEAVPVGDFLSENEFASGVAANASGVVTGVVDPSSEAFLTVGANGFRLSGIQEAIDSVTLLSGNGISIVEESNKNKISAVAAQYTSGQGSTTPNPISVTQDGIQFDGTLDAGEY